MAPQGHGERPQEEEVAQIVICGAGIVGLVLALALDEHVGVKAEVYEKVPTFHHDVGAGMGMYPNGLRVIRDLSPSLFDKIKENGCPYLLRRWERHDGTEVAVAEETVLCQDDVDLESIGIRRWRLLRVLYDAVTEKGIKVHFGRRVTTVSEREDGLTEIGFGDGTTRVTHILFGADGSRSTVRDLVVGNSAHLEYTGVTCIMGMADLARDSPGICFPSSLTTSCHGCFFPTKQNEQCFQIHFPLPEEQADQGTWGQLSKEVGKEECRKLAERLDNDGWDEKYLAPLSEVTHAVRIGFCTLEPSLTKWVYGNYHRIVLLGDAAHPPVPYTGQGAQMGLEDAGVVALLLKRFCLNDDGEFHVANFANAMKTYEKIRIPRAKEIGEISHSWGRMQQKRAENHKYNEVKEEKIKRDIFFHLTLPTMFPGANYDYRAHLEKVLQEQSKRLPVLTEDE